MKLKAVDLCERGFLPEPLPPIFSSRSFGKFVSAIPQNYITLKCEDGKQEFLLDHYSASKRGHNRRLFAIPNPILYFNISLFIERHWSEIETKFSQSKISQSIPKRSFDRATKISSHKSVEVRRIRTTYSYRYVLKSDIAQFYPSIYTHSIPWAAHGKDAAKNDRLWQSTALPFNRLDYYFRMSQSGQTMGIPIGPDASRIVAEFISCSMDEQMRQINSDEKSVRLVDDIWIGCSTLAEAQQRLSQLRQTARNFELQLSEQKTIIKKSSELLGEKWPSEIRAAAKTLRAPLPFSGGEDSDSVSDFITLCLRLAHEHEDEGIIKFAIRTIDSTKRWGSGETWKMFEQFLKVSVLNFPHTIDYVARIIAWKNRVGVVDKSSWRRICNNVVEEHAPLQNDSEATWALWLLWELQEELSKQNFTRVLTNTGSAPCLVAMLLHENKLVAKRTQKKHLLSRFSTESTTGRYWLFVHECLVRGWLSDKDVDLSRDHKTLAKMRNDKVHFLDESRLSEVFYDDGLDEFDADSQPDHGIDESVGGYDDDFEDYEEEIDIDDEVEFSAIAEDETVTDADVPDVVRRLLGDF